MSELIQLNGSILALMSAAVARVNKNEEHTFKGDAGLDEIGLAIGADISVYDWGKRDEKIRYIRFDFNDGPIEVSVRERPALINVDNRPDGDHPTPGTPIAMAA